MSYSQHLAVTKSGQPAMSSTTGTRRLLWLMSASLPLLLALFAAMATLSPEKAHAQDLCGPGTSSIRESFDNGASWDLCWDSVLRENLVLRDVRYTPPNGNPVSVLSSARLSQLHVAYDDGDVTYNDITEFGLGGGYLTRLTPQDCPGGEVLSIRGVAAVCLQRSSGIDLYRTANAVVEAESFSLFSISQVGAYAYIASWTFYSDGAIEPAVGATGALQRSGSNRLATFGRTLAGDPLTTWFSHTHNYYWRLDFDLGDSATDDMFSETRHVLGSDGRRQRTLEVFDQEQARRVEPEALLAWQIWDQRTSNPDASGVLGYQYEPIRSGHRLVRSVTEPFTEFDVFMTVANDCERYASQNARFNPDCLNTALQYTNNESLVGQDVILWNRVSFHHTPRNEDQRNMHTHWDGFVLEPLNVVRITTPIVDPVPTDIAGNSPPEFGELPNLDGQQGDAVDIVLDAFDDDGDVLNWMADGLPAGVEINAAGQLLGTLNVAGEFLVTVRVSDDVSTTEGTFTWRVNPMMVAGDPGATPDSNPEPIPAPDVTPTGDIPDSTVDPSSNPPASDDPAATPDTTVASSSGGDGGSGGLGGIGAGALLMLALLGLRRVAAPSPSQSDG